MKGVIFESEVYVVYVLHGEENPETLAERFLGDREKSWVIEDANEGVPFVKNQTVIIPLRIDNKGGLTASGYQVVPVLTTTIFWRTAILSSASHRMFSISR